MRSPFRCQARWRAPGSGRRACSLSKGTLQRLENQTRSEWIVTEEKKDHNVRTSGSWFISLIEVLVLDVASRVSVRVDDLAGDRQVGTIEGTAVEHQRGLRSLGLIEVHYGRVVDAIVLDRADLAAESG